MCVNARVVYVQIAVGMAFPRRLDKTEKGDMLFLDKLEKNNSEFVQVAY